MSEVLPVVRLKKGREKSVLRRHPWIFSGGILEESDQKSGWVEVQDVEGRVVGFGHYSPASQIRVRLWSIGPARPDFCALIKERLQSAKARRAALAADTDAVRYVNSEGDFMPGIVLDKYADTLVLQIQTAGAEKIREDIVQGVRSVFDEPNLFEKSAGRTEEDLPDRAGVVYGKLPEPAVQIRNGPHRLWVDLAGGHKTGFYLDQRRNIRLLREFMEKETRRSDSSNLLDCFCYTGAFGIGLKEIFGRITSVDSNSAALELCEKNWRTNGGSDKSAEFIRADAFRYLRESAIGPFDAVVLDPPSFAKRKNEVDGACRGYKDILRLSMKAIRPGGVLAAFCCSHHISADLFQKISFAAALDAARQVQILARFGADVDHPVSIDHPEGDYLKGLLLRVLGA